MPTTRRVFNPWFAAVFTGALLTTAFDGQFAAAQNPQPNISDTNSRSGLLTRFVPLESTLPPDKKRDQWYQTRWGDAPNLRKHPNWIKNGGLYGLESDGYGVVRAILFWLTRTEHTDRR